MKISSRQLFTVALIAGIAVCGWLISQRGVGDLFYDDAERAERDLCEKLARSLPRMRRAEIEVLERTRLDGDDFESTRIAWREQRSPGDDTDEGFHPTLHFTVAGIRPRIEALVMTFDQELKGPRRSLAGKSLVLFRRIYSEA